MKGAIYWVVYRIADIHEAILHWNDAIEANLTDKELHFLVIGLFGLVLLMAVEPLVRYLARRGKTGVISWCYTLTVIVGITFAIEIGQYFTGTGTMDFADLVSGVVGYVLFSLAFGAVKRLIRRFLR